MVSLYDWDLGEWGTPLTIQHELIAIAVQISDEDIDIILSD